MNTNTVTATIVVIMNDVKDGEGHTKEYLQRYIDDYGLNAEDVVKIVVTHVKVTPDPVAHALSGSHGACKKGTPVPAPPPYESDVETNWYDLYV